MSIGLINVAINVAAVMPANGTGTAKAILRLIRLLDRPGRVLKGRTSKQLGDLVQMLQTEGFLSEASLALKLAKSLDNNQAGIDGLRGLLTRLEPLRPELEALAYGRSTAAGGAVTNEAAGDGNGFMVEAARLGFAPLPESVGGTGSAALARRARLMADAEAVSGNSTFPLPPVEWRKFGLSGPDPKKVATTEGRVAWLLMVVCRIHTDHTTQGGIAGEIGISQQTLAQYLEPSRGLRAVDLGSFDSASAAKILAFIDRHDAKHGQLMRMLLVDMLMEQAGFDPNRPERGSAFPVVFEYHLRRLWMIRMLDPKLRERNASDPRLRRLLFADRTDPMGHVTLDDIHEGTGATRAAVFNGWFEYIGAFWPRPAASLRRMVAGHYMQADRVKPALEAASKLRRLQAEALDWLYREWYGVLPRSGLKAGNVQIASAPIARFLSADVATLRILDPQFLIKIAHLIARDEEHLAELLAIVKK